MRTTKSGWQTRLIHRMDQMAFNWEVRQGLYRHLASKIANGVAVEVSLDTFRMRLQRQKRMSCDKIVQDMVRRVKDGKTLTKAMEKWIPHDEIGIVQSGELSGNLPRALNLIIESKRRVQKVKRALKSALINPVIYAIAVSAVLWVIGHYVTPGLQMVLPKAKAHGLAKSLFVASDFITSWYALIPIIFLLLIIYAIVKSLPNWTGPTRIKAERYFPFNFYRDMNGYTWLMGFSALLRAGLADVEILKRQRAQAGAWLDERLYTIWWRMENGLSLPDALLEKGLNHAKAFGFPNPDIVDDIASMHGYPDFPEKIAVLATEWSEDLEEKTLENAKRFGFWMEIFMYVIMGWLMLAINDMSNQIASIPGGTKF